MRVIPALLLFLAACASRKPPEEPTITSVPAALIAHTGASFYILEGWDDFLDDGGDMLFLRIPDRQNNNEVWATSPNASWLGEQGLAVALRYGLSRKQIKLIGHVDFQPLPGCPVEVSLFNPDPVGDRKQRIAFRVRLKATTAKNPNLVALEWEVEKLTDGPAPEEAARPGQFPRTAERIDVGSGVIPFGATLLLFHRDHDHRGHYVMLRIASLQE